MGKVLQGFLKQGMPCFFRGMGRTFLFPVRQKLSVISKDTETVPLCFLKLLFRGFLPGRRLLVFPSSLRLILIRDGKIICQQNGGFPCIQPVQPGSKINRIPGSATTKTVKSAVCFHAWCSVIVEWAHCHAIPVYLNPIMFRRLPCCNGLLYGFKYVHQTSLHLSDTKSTIPHGISMKVLVPVYRSISCFL